jgi:hypothetical protein
MSHSDSIFQKYADLLPEGDTDPALTQLIQDLDRIADAPAPAKLRQSIGRTLHSHSLSSGLPARPPLRVLGRTTSPAMPIATIQKHSRVRRLLVTAAVVILAAVVITRGGAFALSKIDPGLAFQLGIPVATGPEYTTLQITRVVADRTVTLSRASLTTKQAIIGYTYDLSPQSAGAAPLCARSLTSREGDTFKEFAEDHIGEGAHGSTVMYFSVVHLAAGQQDRHLHLVLHPCEGPSVDADAAFDFTLPLQN